MYRTLRVNLADLASQPSFLRTVLLIDAAVGVASGLMLVFRADLFASLTHLPPTFLRASGLVLLPFGALLAFLATRSPIAAAGVWFVIVVNAVWVLASFWLIFAGPYAANALGVTLVAAQALAVALLADLEYLGLRQRPVV